MSSPPQPPPGFYRDPDGLPLERWWDGDQWTDKKRPLQSEPSETRPPEQDLERRWNWRRIANYKSRNRRSEFWAAIGLGYVAFMVAAIVDAGGNPDLEWLAFLAGFTAIWLVSGASVNRLHDTGRSGWMVLLLLVPIANLVIFIMMGVNEGQPDVNEWGPPVG